MDLRVAQGTWVVLASIALLVSYQTYRAISVHHHALLQERQALETQSSAVEAMLRSSGGRDAWLAAHQQALQTLIGRLPPQAQLPHLLNAVAEVVKTSDVRLVDLMQGNVEPVERDGQPLLMQGLPLGQLPLTVTAEGRYHAVRTVLERLTDQTFPGVVGVRHVEMARPTTGGPRLSVTLHLVLYVTMPPVERSS